MKASDYSDVFISYRRLDVEFVKRLVAVLRDRGKEVWIDWEDIPPGSAVFTEDIRRGIEGADAFIAVLTPDYLDSKYCTDVELAYAVELRKRIIPIVLRKFEGINIPTTIGHVNWIYFTPHAGQENTFDDAVQRVIEALETDIDYVRTHKRLGMRALEWVRFDRKPSRLLQGDDITEAEAFISTGAYKNPIPTPLHGEYILVSRKAHQRRLQQLIASITVGLVITIILTVIALLLWREATVQRELAERERRIAERRSEEALSVAYANGAQVALASGDTDSALALAYTAASIANPPYASQRALADVLNAPGTRFRFADHTNQVKSAAVHPTQPLIVTASSDHTSIVYNWQTGERVTTLSSHDDWVNVAAFNSDGTRLLTGSSDFSIIVWETPTWTEHMRFPTAGSVIDAVFTPDNAAILAALCLARDNFGACSEAQLTLYDAGDGTPLLDFEPAHSGEIFSVAVSPDGTQALTGASDATAILWDIGEGTPIRRLEAHTSEVNGVAFVSDGRRALTASTDKLVYLWNLETGAVIRQYAAHGGRVFAVALSPDGQTFASTGEDSSIFLWNLETGARLGVLTSHDSAVFRAAYTSDGCCLVTPSQDATVRVWNLDSSLQTQVARGLSAPIFFASALAQDDTRLIAGDAAGGVAIWDISQPTPELLTRRTFDGAIYALDATADGATILVGFANGDLIRLDADGREQARTNAHDETLVHAIDITHDGTHALTCGEDNLMTLRRVDDLTVVRTFSGHDNWINNCAFSPDETRALTASSDYTVGYWNVAAGTLIHRFTGHDWFVWSAHFSPDGRYAVSGSEDATAIIWDLTTLEQVRRFTGGHSVAILEAQFTPDGAHLLTGSRDARILLWDAATALPMQAWAGHTATVYDFRFTADTTRVYTSSRDATIRGWRLLPALDQLLTLASDGGVRYLRQPTEQEQRAFALSATVQEQQP